jgi:hypothetical protein
MEVIMKENLEQIGGSGEYILTGERVWIEVDNISICIVKTDEGVVVDAWANGYENLSDSMATLGVMFEEAQAIIEEVKMEIGE